ncbi:MAG TPA: alpha/beta fold hydrolase [Phenylobacterium sp.]|jgi:3-oxoadipate enol-lactonase|uniref:alpha/beta fold hydrolase n=1 Tax=Phenylobacterium sp. TaxID=1871053 RepID=UPI002C197B6C|nr:alpha/beta fold hydrolase [Phenylobacterium sp.]HXA38590.1 alpha/beta fold hydrolase [Phenylobacterium sp.]
MIRRMTALACALALSASVARAAMVDVDGGQLYYETCGAGPQAVVLIHDGVINSASFDDMWPILCRDFRVVRYDRRGYGKSPAAKAPYSPQEDLAAVMAAAKMDHASLAGFSFGGGLAVSYAILHPEQVDRLIISGAAINGFQPTKNFRDHITHVMLPMIIGNFDAVIANASKETWIMAPGHDAARAKIAALIKASPQDLRHQTHDPIKGWSSDLPRMPGLNVPTLIMTGDHDIADNQAASGAAQALIPGSRRIVVEDAGHLMQLEHPKEVAELIADFVRKGR